MPKNDTIAGIAEDAKNSRPLLTPHEVAVRVRQSPRTIRAWAQSGRVPGLKIGRGWRFDPNVIDELIGGAGAQ